MEENVFMENNVEFFPGEQCVGSEALRTPRKFYTVRQMVAANTLFVSIPCTEKPALSPFYKNAHHQVRFPIESLIRCVFE